MANHQTSSAVTQQLIPLISDIIAMHKQGRIGEAEAGYREVLQNNPAEPDALHYLGLVCLQTGRTEDGLNWISQSLSAKPDQVAALGNRAMGYMATGKLSQAQQDLENAAKLDPNSVGIKVNLAGLLLRMGKFRDAIHVMELTRELAPESAKIHQVLGTALYGAKRYQEALLAFEKAMQIAPDLGDQESLCSVLSNISSIFIIQGNMRGAVNILQRILSLDAWYPLAIGDLAAAKMPQCDWNGLDQIKQSVLEGIQAGLNSINPFTLLNLVDDPQYHLACAKRYSQEKFPNTNEPLYKGQHYQHERIKIAYLSADLHDHATAHLMVGMFEKHDRTKFEVYAVSYGVSDQGPVRQRLLAAFEHFIEVNNGETDAEIAQLLHRLEIDIAIDLKGFTHEGRVGIFSYRPAPVQVSYLGYPGTLGVSYMDYVIADRVVIPEDQQCFYTERLAYLPNCYQITDDRRAIADAVPARIALGLPQDAMVYCCFNNPQKITSQVFDIWMTILKAVPGSVLWLFKGSQETDTNLKREAMARGVDQNRLVFAGRVSQADHLARHKCADLFLDTAPYNAHTSASDALWAGLPVLTVPGKSFASRVAASILLALDMPELIAADDDQYAAQAIEYGFNRNKLKLVKEKLKVNIKVKPLFNTELFTRDFEALLASLSPAQ